MTIKLLTQDPDEKEKAINMEEYIAKHENKEQLPPREAASDAPEAHASEDAELLGEHPSIEDELAEMRLQLRHLQQQLDQQTTLRADSLKKLLSRPSHVFRNRELASAIFVGLVAVGMPPMLHNMGMSTLFCFFTGLFFLFGLGWEIYFYRKFHLSNLMELDLLTTAKHLTEYKRINQVWLYKIGFPFIAVWFTWYLCELVHTMPIPDGIHKGLFIAITAALLILGGVIGGLIGYFSFYRPQMRLASEMIMHIRELESTKE